MPMPSVSSVLQLAYAEAQRLARQPDDIHGTPEMRTLIDQVWLLVKERLSVDDERVKVIDELIAKVTLNKPCAASPQA